MKVLLVHGMGRTPLSMWRLARSLQREGLATEMFGYVAAWQSVGEIVRRLTARLQQLAGDDYIVIGHSLGGVLLRDAVESLPPATRRPRRIIMLGTPNRSPRLARHFQHAFWYRALNGDAGQLLASESRLAGVARTDVPCTVIAGTRGIGGRWDPFRGDPNDGLVAVAETELAGAEEWITLPVMHPFIMNDRRVGAIVRERCVRLSSLVSRLSSLVSRLSSLVSPETTTSPTLHTSPAVCPDRTARHSALHVSGPDPVRP